MKFGEYLYKGLNEDEIKQGRLILDLRESAVQHPRLPLQLPFRLGESAENAMRNQQKELPTSYISATTSFDVAVKYATNFGLKDGVVAKISVHHLMENGILLRCVSESGEVAHPEDDEVLMINGNGKEIPCEVIAEMIPVKAKYFKKLAEKVKERFSDLC